MKNIKLIFFTLISLWIGFACEDDKTIETIDISKAIPASIITPSEGSNQTLLLANAETNLETFSWSEADFGLQVPKKYSLQLDIAGNEFKKPLELINTAELNYTTTVAEMNLKLWDFGITSGTSTDFELRVVTTLNKPIVDSTYNSVIVNLSFQPFIYNKPDVIEPVAGSSFVLELDTIGLEIWDTIIWQAVDYGISAVKNYVLEFDHIDSSFSKPVILYSGVKTQFSPTVLKLNKALLSRGYTANVAADVAFRIRSSVDSGKGKDTTEVFTYKITPFSSEIPPPEPDNYWALVGTATPNGWGHPDLDMEWDWKTNIWTLTTDLVAGEFKFRADDAWTVNYGDNGNDGSLEQDGANIPLPAAGNYTIQLILTDVANPTYTVVKN